MIAEAYTAMHYLKDKFGEDINNVQPGTYAVPFDTSEGLVYLRVVVSPELDMSDFRPFLDEAMTIPFNSKEN